MLRFTGRRVLWAIPTLLIISFLVFMALRAGTDPVASYVRVNPGHAGEDPAVPARPTALSGACRSSTSVGPATSSRGTGVIRSRATGRCGRR